MYDLMTLLRDARRRGASDLHIVSGLPPAVRLNGQIEMMKGPALSSKETDALSLSLLSPGQREQLQSEKELCFALSDGAAGRARASVYYHAGLAELAIRLCSLEVRDPAALGIPSVVTQMSRLEGGLVLITGPNGVGKTTTLNHLIDAINRERRVKIVTLEDPVEYVHRSFRSIVVQQERGIDFLTFPRALVHAVRQNPDVIVIGEMRERATVRTALSAASTGHLVLATLHTPSVCQTVERIAHLLDADERKEATVELSTSLKGVVAQDLIPRADGSGLALACEILIPNPAVRNLIRENRTQLLANTLVSSRKEGMISMDAAVSDLYRKAVITYDAARSRMLNPALIAAAGVR